MRVFITGASGFIGTAVTQELHEAGHHVIGLARSDAAAQAILANGAEVLRGDLEDLDSLRQGASQADAVIHTGFVHDFSRFLEVCAIDRHAIGALGAALAGTDRPLIITSGTGMGSAVPGEPATEDHFDPAHPNPRAASELAGAEVLASGVDLRVVRLPQVHNTLKQGLITYLIALAREKGVSAYVGEGQNRWAAVHLSDAARLYKLALEKGKPGGRYHAVGEEGVPMRLIAESIGRGLHAPTPSMSPEEAGAHFGWLAGFAGVDMPASSALTQERLGWTATGTGLIADLDNANLSQS